MLHEEHRRKLQNVAYDLANVIVELESLPNQGCRVSRLMKAVHHVSAAMRRNASVHQQREQAMESGRARRQKRRR